MLSGGESFFSITIINWMQATPANMFAIIRLWQKPIYKRPYIHTVIWCFHPRHIFLPFPPRRYRAYQAMKFV